MRNNYTNTLFKSLTYKNGIFHTKLNADTSYPDDAHSDLYKIEDTSFWFKHRAYIIKSIIEAFPFAADSCLLDVGGGNGYMTRYLENNGISSVLVEPGAQGVLNAKHRGCTNIAQSTLEDMNLSENSVAAIGLFDVLEHIENDLGFLKFIFDKLEAKGKLYITVPAYTLLWTHEDVFAGHYRRYSVRELSEIMASVGFKVTYASYFFKYLIIPIFIFRKVPFMLLKGIKNTAKSNVGQHKTNTSLLGRLALKIFSREATQISRRKKIRFGASIIICAEKINH